MSYAFNAAFAAFLMIAAVQDTRRREVEHWTVIGMLALALGRMLYFQDYKVLYALIPGAVFALAWYFRPEACGAADIKVMVGFFLYTGVELLPLLAIILACALAAVHMLILKVKTTPFCTWLGACGILVIAIKTVVFA
jgi:Flp pilus assembly protein protease CpaA